MNAPMNRETSPPKLSVLPDGWIAKIFDHMAAMYGSKFADLWRGTEPEKVRAMWAEKLAGFADKPQAIKQALSALDDHPFPPTMPEFLALCRDAAKRIGDNKPALTHKPTEEELDHQRKMATQIHHAIGAGKLHNGIDTHWATHPRSEMHLGFIFDAAKADPMFKPCIEQMVADGICTAEGRLLKRYSGVNCWESLRRAA